MKEVFYISSHQYINHSKVKLYLQSAEKDHWTLDINEAQDLTSYSAAQAMIETSIKPGDHLQIERFFVPAYNFQGALHITGVIP